MVRGLTLKWKQVIGYHLTKHSIGVNKLKDIIFNAIRQLRQIGLIVDVLVMDQESSQWKLVKDLGVNPQNTFFRCDNVEEETKCHIIPDPPHLIKNLRNNFLDKDISFSLDGVSKTAKFKYVRKLYEIDSLKPIRAVPRLKEEHFTLPRGKKMKVILACQIFSHSVAAAIRFYIKHSQLPDDAAETADFIDTINSMWDFVDSHSLSAPIGKKAVSSKNIVEDIKLFDFYFDFVSTFEFTSLLTNKSVKLPSHVGWLLAIKSFKALCVSLIQDQKIFSHLCLRKCNQDHVENLHSQIRSNNGFNDHPTPEGYINALRCLASNSSICELLDKTISSGANCQPDKEHSTVHSNVFEMTNISTCASESALDTSDSLVLLEDGDTLQLESLDTKIEQEIVDYIAGSVVRNITKQKTKHDICEDCIHLCISSNYSSNSCYSLTSLKEYKKGALISVSSAVSAICVKFEEYFQKCTCNGLPHPNPRTYIVSNFNK